MVLIVVVGYLSQPFLSESKHRRPATLSKESPPGNGERFSMYPSYTFIVSE